MNIIYKFLHGSRCYGLHDENSDYDYKGIYVPTIDELLSLKEHKKVYSGSEGNIDYCVFSLDKFFKLLINGNLGCMEWLYCASENIHLINYQGRLLLENRDLFLSKNIYHSVKGYSFNHWRKVIGDYPDTGKRRKDLIKKYGYDTKAAMNMIRIVLEGIEILTYGKITLPLKNVDFLKEVKYGKKSVDEVKKKYDESVDLLDVAYSKSKLPETLDLKKINDLYLKLIKISKSV